MLCVRSFISALSFSVLTLEHEKKTSIYRKQNINAKHSLIAYYRHNARMFLMKKIAMRKFPFSFPF